MPTPPNTPNPGHQGAREIFGAVALADSAGNSIIDDTAGAIKNTPVTVTGDNITDDTADAIKTLIVDPADGSAAAKVTQVRSENALHVVTETDGEDPDDYVNTYLFNSSSNDMGIDGTTPVSFTYTPPAGKDLILGRVMVYYSSGTAFSEEKFAHLTALSNGVEINVNGTTIETWKDNVDVITSQFDLSNAGRAFTKEDKSLAGRWTFHKAAGDIQGLLIENGNTVEFKIQDNLADLTIFRAKIQGLLVPVVA